MNTNRPEQVASMVEITLRRNALRVRSSRNDVADVCAFARSIGRDPSPRDRVYQSATYRLFRLDALRAVALAEAEWLRVFLAGTPEETSEAWAIVNANEKTITRVTPETAARVRRGWNAAEIEFHIADRERFAATCQRDYAAAIA